MNVNLKGKGNQTAPRMGVQALKKDIKANNSNFIKFKKRIKERRFRSKGSRGSGVIYLGKIPHGFYEDQMIAYFNQFGKVISAVVPRSKKSGRSKGYGFVEFEDEEVAKIAAETMNNYLMYNKILKCRYIPPEERKTAFLRQTNRTTCPKVINRIKNTKVKRESLSKLDQSAYQQKTQHKILQFKQFFEERGINFNFKMNTCNGDNVNTSNDSEKNGIKHSRDAEDKMDDEFGVLEIDASDAEIHFRIPPQVKKIIKKSTNFPAMSPNGDSQTEKKIKIIKNKKIKGSKKSHSAEVDQALKTKLTKRKKPNLEEKKKGKDKSPGGKLLKQKKVGF